MNDGEIGAAPIVLPVDLAVHDILARNGQRDQPRWWSVVVAVLLHVAIILWLLLHWLFPVAPPKQLDVVPVKVVFAPPPPPPPPPPSPRPAPEATPAPPPEPQAPKPRQSGKDEKSTTVAAAEEQAPEAAAPPPAAPTKEPAPTEHPSAAPPLPDKSAAPQDSAKSKVNKEVAHLDPRKEANKTRAPLLAQPRHLEFERGDREQVGDPYLNRLRDLIEQHRIYPNAVGPLGLPLEGVATYRVAIDRAGNLRGISIEHSSGAAALDQVGENIVQNTAPFPPLPRDYPGEGVVVTLRLPLFSEHP